MMPGPFLHRFYLHLKKAVSVVRDWAADPADSNTSPHYLSGVNFPPPEVADNTSYRHIQSHGFFTAEPGELFGEEGGFIDTFGGVAKG